MEQLPKITCFKPENIIYAYTDDGYPKERIILSEARDNLDYIVGYIITTCGKIYHHDLYDRVWKSTKYSEEELVTLAVNNKQSFPRYLREFILEYFKGNVQYLEKRKKYQNSFIQEFLKLNKREPTNEEIEIWKNGFDNGNIMVNE